MLEEPDAGIAQLAATVRSGSIVAAAGCGKTEQIVRATQIAEGRRLILTHTHSGKDALRLRLKKYNILKEKYRIDTIAGWCLIYAASFPKSSGLACDKPREDMEWNVVYEAAARLIHSGAVRGVLESSYSGVFVDEYQDCTALQHQVIKAIAAYLPVCVFGDPLQAIFDFKGQRPVDWDTDVFPVFSKVREMVTPWRWRKEGNTDLAYWLSEVRNTLEQGCTIDLTSRPECVNWVQLPNDPKFRYSKIVSTCTSVMGAAKDARLVVIGDSANINARAELAKKLAKVGFSNIEPLACKDLYKFAHEIKTVTGLSRLEKSIELIFSCMTGVNKKAFLVAVKSHLDGGKRGVAEFGNLIALGITVVENDSDEALLELMQGFHRRDDTNLSRKEMFFTMLSALKLKSTGQYATLSDAIWEVRNRFRHAGRTIWKRSIGSTLLIKGLEFEHAVIVYAENMTRKDWYVALTRATNSVTIVSPSECFTVKT